MIDLSILPVYLTAVVALLLLPGPDMLLIASSSLSYGRKAGVFASLGNATSGIILTSLAAMGVSAMIAMSPIALKALHFIGGLYLVKMGWDSFRTCSIAEPEIDRTNKMVRSLYRKAVLTNLLNPKALLFFVLFLPQFVSSNIETSTSEQMLILGLLLNVLGLLFNLILVITVGTLGKSLLTNKHFYVYQHRVMGTVFLLLGAWLLLSQVPAAII